MDAEPDMYLFFSMLPFSGVYSFMNVSLYFFCPCFYYCTMCDAFWWYFKKEKGFILISTHCRCASLWLSNLDERKGIFFISHFTTVAVPPNCIKSCPPLLPITSSAPGELLISPFHLFAPKQLPSSIYRRSISSRYLQNILASSLPGNWSPQSRGSQNV